MVDDRRPSLRRANDNQSAMQWADQYRQAAIRLATAAPQQDRVTAGRLLRLAAVYLQRAASAQGGEA